jgi:uncharacterized protein
MFLPPVSYLRKWLWRTGLSALVGMNAVAFFHAYKFTHFAPAGEAKTQSPEKLGPWQKAKALLFGVSNPRPHNHRQPARPFATVTLPGEPALEAWHLRADSARGTVALFHGYSGRKADLLLRAEELLALGYSTLLVDFMGSGGSGGNHTTLGYREAAQVKAACDYLAAQGERNIFLFGNSMGAVAAMKCVHDYGLAPAGLILECPFGSMYATTCARFRVMGAPEVPMAGLLVFWGGAQHGFWALGHNPTEYAKAIRCPTLLLYGEKDRSVSRAETDEIFANLAGPKSLHTFAKSGHEDYLLRHRHDWQAAVGGFLGECSR